MQLQYKLNDRISIIASAETQLELFESIAELKEVFGEECCGKCKSPRILFRVRKVTQGKKEYIYPEMTCEECHAKLTFGQMEGGKLFPVKFQREEGEYLRDKDNRLIPKGTRGWVKYNKETGKEE